MIFLFHTKWKDICVFSFQFKHFVLQGRKNKITGASKFRISKPNIPCSVPSIKNLNEEKLAQANMWNQCDDR